MAMRVEEITVGVDVAKGWLDIATGNEEEGLLRIDNTAKAIGRWLQTVSGPMRLAVEATGSYHELLVELTQRAGCRVYLVDALKLSRYRDAVGQRAKTDVHDARLLRRYLLQEAGHLRALQPINAGARQVWRLLKRRATVVRTGVQVRQSLGEMVELADSLKRYLQELQRLVRDIDRQLRHQARALGWAQDVARLRAVPGIGPLNALGLVAAFHRGEFCNADRFVAFLGLDVRVRDSGLMRGRRKLTKKGEPEIRRLLYNAAMTASRGYLAVYYRSLLERGMATTAALVALARKLVRVAHALLYQQSHFDVSRRACVTT